MGENGSGGRDRLTDPSAKTSDQRTRYRFYGRRRGRKLRPGRRRLIDERLPALRVTLDAVSDPAWAATCGYEACWLEIGFGAGEHLAWQAKTHPDVLMIGAEPYINGVAALIARIEQDGLNNIRIWPDDVRPLLEGMPDASLARIFILHPDPWPKTRHAGRRLVSAGQLDTIARLLTDGGVLRIASDDPRYIDATMIAMARRDDFRWRAEGPADWRRRPADWPATRYGRKAERAGRPPVHLEFRKRAS